MNETRLRPIPARNAPSGAARAPEAPLPLFCAAMVLGVGMTLGHVLERRGAPAAAPAPSPAPAPPAAPSLQPVSGLDLVNAAAKAPAAQAPASVELAATGALEAPIGADAARETLVPLAAARPAPPPIAAPEPAAVPRPALVRREFVFGNAARAGRPAQARRGCNCGPGASLNAQNINWVRPGTVSSAVHAAAGIQTVRVFGLGAGAPAVAVNYVAAGGLSAAVNSVGMAAPAMMRSLGARCLGQ